MKVLVLGATGFIGGQIARAALEAGWEVNGLRRILHAKGDLTGQDINWFVGRLSAPASVEAALRGVDVIFHAAGFYATKTPLGQLHAQLNQARSEMQAVIDLARQANVKRLIYTSSFTTIGQVPPGEDRPADERDVYQSGTIRRSGYHEAKILMEKMILEAAAQGLPAVVLNPTLVLGPGDVHLSSGQVLVDIARRKFPGWAPGTINIVDVRDVARAQIAAVERGRIGERYLLGGENLTIREALARMAQAAGTPPPQMEIPLWPINLIAALCDVLPFLPIPTNTLRSLPYLKQSYSSEKARRELGFTSRPLEETLRDALAWYRSQGVLKN